MRQSSNRRKKLGSYPFISVIFSITLSLFVVGLFGLLLLLTNSLTSSIRENVEIQVFLDKPIADNEITRLQKIIGSKPFVSTSEGQSSIQHISKEAAAASFFENTGEDFSKFLGDNPLRDVLMVKILPDYQSSDSLTWITKDIESLKGVYEVSYVASLVEKINRNLAKVGAILLGFAALFLIVVVILINNTIKLALYSQRFLIRSMQLVGATGSFIRSPFLTRSAFYGLLAGLIASGAIYLTNAYLLKVITDLESLYDQQKFLMMCAVLILLGVFIAWLSTYRAIVKYLKISLDELY